MNQMLQIQNSADVKNPQILSYVPYFQIFALAKINERSKKASVSYMQSFDTSNSLSTRLRDIIKLCPM